MKMRNKTPFYTLLWTPQACVSKQSTRFFQRQMRKRRTHTWGIQNPYVTHLNDPCKKVERGGSRRNEGKQNPLLNRSVWNALLQLSGSSWKGWLHQKVSYPLSHFAFLLRLGASTHWKKHRHANFVAAPHCQVQHATISHLKCATLNAK